MGYLDFERIKRVLMLDKAVYVEIRDDDKAVGQAGGIFLLASVVGGVWQILSLGDMPVYLLILFTIPLIWIVETGILHMIAKFLGGRSSFTGYLKTIGYAQAPYALGIIPVIGTFIGGIWSLICLVTATEAAHELSLGRAIAVWLLLLVVAIAVVMLLGVILWQMAVFNLAT